MNTKVLIACRKIIDFSQEKMSNQLGISLVTYNQKEKGKSEFTGTEMKKIAEIINENGLKNLTVNDIFFKDLVTIELTNS